MSRDNIIGYIYHIRVQEVLKADQWVQTNQIVQIFVPGSLEDGVSLPRKQRFLLALARFDPKKEIFGKAFVSKVSDPLTKPGVAFDLRRRYYRVAADRNGAILITDKNSNRINEIRAAIRLTPSH